MLYLTFVLCVKNSNFALVPHCIIGGRDLVAYEASAVRQKEWIESTLKASNIS